MGNGEQGADKELSRISSFYDFIKGAVTKAEGPDYMMMSLATFRHYAKKLKKHRGIRSRIRKGSMKWVRGRR